MAHTTDTTGTPKTQLDFWDRESTGPGYCQRHLRAMEQANLLDMLDAGLRLMAPDAESSWTTALEIGGGSQMLSRRLAAANPALRVVCTDISQRRIDEFTRYYGNVPSNLELRGNVDAQALPFPDGTFDLIVGDAVLHHIDCLKRALIELNRCLRSNGTALIVREPVIGFLGQKTYRFLQYIGRDTAHIQKNRFEYKRMLEQWSYEFIMAGFAVKVLRRWPRQQLLESVRSSFPSLLPCYVGFLLQKRVDVTGLGLRV